MPGKIWQIIIAGIKRPNSRLINLVPVSTSKTLNKSGLAAHAVLLSSPQGAGCIEVAVPSQARDEPKADNGMHGKRRSKWPPPFTRSLTLQAASKTRAYAGCGQAKSYPGETCRVTFPECILHLAHCSITTTCVRRPFLTGKNSANLHDLSSNAAHEGLAQRFPNI